jgi:hypothetical protein
VRTLTATPPVVAAGQEHEQGRRVALALWPGEARRLALSPIVIGAFAFTVLVATRFGPTGIRGFAGLIFGLFVFLAANLAALRTRRERMDELCESLPAGAAARTSSHVLALIGPAIAVAFLTTGVWLSDTARLAASSEHLSVLDAAQGPLLVILFGAMGVAMARWAPLPPAALPGVVGLAMVTGAFASSCGTVRCSTVWFGPWVNRVIDSNGATVGIRAGSAGWHAVYLVGLILVVSVLAIGRHRRGRAEIVAGLLGLAIMVIAGILQVP